MLEHGLYMDSENKKLVTFDNKTLSSVAIGLLVFLGAEMYTGWKEGNVHKAQMEERDQNYTPRETQVMLELQKINAKLVEYSTTQARIESTLNTIQSDRFTKQQGELLRQYIEDVNTNSKQRDDAQDERIERVLLDIKESINNGKN